MHTKRTNCQNGFTLMSLLIVIGLIGVLSTIAYPGYLDYVDRARTGQATADLARMALAIDRFRSGSLTDELPETLAEIGYGDLEDPWGNTYRYVRFEDVDGDGPLRKNAALNAINTQYDLYSTGEDGLTAPELASANGMDDIVRGLDGNYMGLAKDYPAAE